MPKSKLIGGRRKNWTPSSHKLIEIIDSQLVHELVPEEYQQYISAEDIVLVHKRDYSSTIFIIFQSHNLLMSCHEQGIIEFGQLIPDKNNFHSMFPYGYGFGEPIKIFKDIKMVKFFDNDLEFFDKFHANNTYTKYTYPEQFPNITIIDQYNTGFVIHYSDDIMGINILTSNDGKYDILIEYNENVDDDDYFDQCEFYTADQNVLLPNEIESIGDVIINIVNGKDVHEYRCINTVIDYITNHRQTWSSEIIQAYNDFTDTYDLELPAIII